uniref:PiggyBac transposable element-derived protein 4 C-terminal zinc-ribbon domain-containing protein n=1 Tax=Clastoptera arizonana TaxID=38151 RepID=A0A1B6CKN1_9HEMI
MNVAEINTQILFTSGLPTEAPDRRIIFLKNLAQDFMKEQLYARSGIKNLPIDVKAFLSLRYPKRSIEDVEETSTSSDAVPTKKRVRGSCKKCKSRKSNTTKSCKKCSAFVCGKHSKIVCDDCLHAMEDISKVSS